MFSDRSFVVLSNENIEMLSMYFSPVSVNWAMMKSGSFLFVVFAIYNIGVIIRTILQKLRIVYIYKLLNFAKKNIQFANKVVAIFHNYIYNLPTKPNAPLNDADHVGAFLFT